VTFYSQNQPTLTAMYAGENLKSGQTKIKQLAQVAVLNGNALTRQPHALSTASLQTNAAG
jgi:hypothetical protein